MCLSLTKFTLLSLSPPDREYQWDQISEWFSYFLSDMRSPTLIRDTVCWQRLPALVPPELGTTGGRGAWINTQSTSGGSSPSPHGPIQWQEGAGPLLETGMDKLALLVHRFSHCLACFSFSVTGQANMPKSSTPHTLSPFRHCGARGSLQKAAYMIWRKCWGQQYGRALNRVWHLPALNAFPLTVLVQLGHTS